MRLGRSFPARPIFGRAGLSSPDVSTALTGSAATAALGAFGLALTLALTGLSITSGTGTVSVGPTAALGGQQISSAQGVLQSQPHGLQINVQQGTLTRGGSGQLQINVQQGTLTYVPLQLVGQVISVGQGTLSPTGAPVTVSLSGAESVMGQGSVAIGALTLSGQEITVSQGTLVFSQNYGLVGNQIDSAAGVLAASQDVNDTFIQSQSGIAYPDFSFALTGQQIAIAQGNIVYSQISLLGSHADFSQGATVQLIGIALFGQKIDSSIGNVTQIGGVTPVISLQSLPGGSSKLKRKHRVRRWSELPEKERIKAVHTAKIKPLTAPEKAAVNLGKAPEDEITEDEMILAALMRMLS